MAKTSRDGRYSSKIIKAGALLPDTKLILGGWDENLDAQTNLDRVRRDNLLGKGSRSRVEDILAIFRQRYVADATRLKEPPYVDYTRLEFYSLDRCRPQ